MANAPIVNEIVVQSNYPTLAKRSLGWGTRWPGALALVAATLLLAGCREDMHNQPKFIPLRENSFYPDLRSARPIPEGTVARGQLEDDALLYTGKVDGKEADQFPFQITAPDLARGQERFNIYCSPCHSQLGDGNGMIVQRGFKRPPDYTDPRLMKAPVGHFFNVMTNGWGSMADYSAQIPIADRWRIAAYIRALQFSRTAKPADVPAGQKVSTQPPAPARKQTSMAAPATHNENLATENVTTAETATPGISMAQPAEPMNEWADESEAK
jgi:mono/diheme cytochrome c family protein